MASTDKPVQIETGRALSLSTASTRYHSKVKHELVRWPEFVARIQDPVRTAETFAEYQAARKKDRDNIKDVGYFVVGKFANGVRKKCDVVARDAIALDGDHFGPDFADVLGQMLGDCAHAYYSTHSHSPDKPRIRVVVPLTRSVSGDEYPAVARAIAARIGIDYFDDSTYDPSRAMYWPSHSSDGKYAWDENENADWLDPGAVLAELEDWTDARTWPISSRESAAPGSARPRSITKAEDPLGKKGVVGAFCRTHSIGDAIATFLPEVYGPGADDSRFTYLSGTTSNGAVVYDAKFLFSHHGTDPAAGRLLNAFDLVRAHRFGELDADTAPDTPVNRTPSYLAMVELAEGVEAVRTELAAAAIEGFEDADDADSRRNVLKRLELDSRGRVLPKLTNIVTILQEDPTLAGAAGLNELTTRLARLKATHWAADTPGAEGSPWQNRDDLGLRHDLETRYGVEVSAARVIDVVNTVADSHRFHPVREYLNRLAWDRTPRVSTMLHRYVGVERSAYADAVSRKVMCAAVARVFNPGCKFDSVMILEGGQGIRKSTFVATLAGPWFGDNLTTFTGKEAVEQIQGKWIIELGELQAFRKSEIETIKAFISRQEDFARLAYERRPETFPRQSIFIGTTNSDQYLRDETGARRFWPIRCAAKLIDTEALKAERDQLWAEALVLWRAGERLYLDDADAAAQAIEVQAERYVADEWRDIIAEWLTEPIADDHWERLPDSHDDPDFGDEPTSLVERDRACTLEIWSECLGFDARHITQRDQRRIARCMTLIDGWSGSGKDVRFGQRYGKRKGFTKCRPIA